MHHTHQTRPVTGRFDHAALIVDSDDTVEHILVPMLREHVAAGERVLMVVSAHTERAVRKCLGSQADALEWAATDAFYQRLGVAFEGFRRYLETEHAEGRTVHVVAEPDVHTDLTAPVDRVAAYLSYESVCNDAYAGFGCPVTCLWDSRRHPTLVIEGVRSIHDHELTEKGRQENTAFIRPADYLAGRAQVTMSAPPRLVDQDFTLATPIDLAGCRAVILSWAMLRGFADGARHQVAAATNEVASNGLRHGRAPVRVRAWRHDQTLVVQVDDAGARPIPPYAGYRPPVLPASRGMGLWLARQFADILLTHTDDERTAVRMYFPHGLTHQ